MLLAVFLPRLLTAARRVLNNPGNRMDLSNIIIMALLVVLLAMSFFFRSGVDAMPRSGTVQPPKKAYSLMLEQLISQ